MKGTKYLWVVVIVVLAGVTLVACGGEPPTPTPVPPTSTPAATPTPSANEHLEQGIEYAEQGRLDEAIAEFQKALELDPDDPDAHHNLGTAYFEQGRLDEAITELQAAIELEPGGADVHRNLGTVYGEQGKPEEAAAAYEEAIDLDPDFGEAYGDLAGTYTELGRLSEAVAAGEKAVELAPDYAMARNNLGFVYYRQGMLDEAIVEYQEAIRINPDFVKAHDNLGVAYLMQDQLDEAIAEFEEVIRIDPEHAGGHVNLGFAYYRQGMLDEAIAEYQEAIRLNPNSAMPRKNLGLAYRDQGRVGEAITEFENYLQLIPPDAPDRTAVEEMIAKLNEQTAGAEYRNAAGGYSLRYPESWYHAGEETEVTLAPSKEDYQASSLRSPLITFITWPVAEATGNFGLEENAAPVEFLQVMARAVKAKTEDVQSVEIAGYPAAVAATSGSMEGSLYTGNLIIILVEERLFLAEALAPPDQWDDVRPTFVDMVNSLSFFAPSAEYRNADGGYSLTYSVGWYYEETSTQVEFAESEEALQVAGEETVGILFNAGPLADFAENLDLPASTSDPVVVWEAMVDLIGAAGKDMETFEIAGYPAAASDISGTDDDTPFEGGIAVVLVEERLLYGVAMAPPDQWGDFRSTFVNMVNSLSFTPSSSPTPAERGDGDEESTNEYDTVFPLPENVQNFTGEGGEGRVNFQTNLTMDEVIAFYREAVAGMGLSEYDLLTTIEDEGFSMVFTGWPSGEELVIQGVVFGEATNVNIRLEEVVES